jgi:hypothetical protein
MREKPELFEAGPWRPVDRDDEEGGDRVQDIHYDIHALGLDSSVRFSGPYRREVKQVGDFCRDGPFILISPADSAGGHVRRSQKQRSA